MKVKNSDIRQILTSQTTIFRERNLKVRTICWLSRLEKELVNNFKIYEEERRKFNEDYCMMDEKGTPLMKNGAYQFENDAKRKELFAKVDELLSLEIEMGMDKLKINLGEFKRGGGKVRCPNCNQETMNEPETSLVNAEDLMFLGPFVDFEDP